MAELSEMQADGSMLLLLQAVDRELLAAGGPQHMTTKFDVIAIGLQEVSAGAQPLSPAT